jgi:predicted phage terminase large subunit-like protein
VSAPATKPAAKPATFDWSYDGGVLDAPLLAPSDPWAQALAEVFGDTSPTLAPEDLANGVLEPAPRMPLRQFVEQAWPILEPESLFIPNWHIDAICAHLEAVIDGRIRRLVINVPPGFMKSLLVCVFWPAWIWTFRPGWRGIFSSYAGDLAIRDSVKCRTLIESEWYKGTFAPSWQLASDQNVKSYFQNTRMGFRLSLSVGGKGTGFRGHCVVVDDPLNVKDAFSDLALDEAVRWWDKTMSTRLSDQRTGARVVVMQRLHEKDLSGHVLRRGGYDHLCIPMEFEPTRRCVTSIGFQDPRTEEGDLAFPELFPASVVEELKTDLGSDGAAGQLQQRPTAAEGGIFKRTWWKRYDAIPPVFRELAFSLDCTFKDTDGTDYVCGGVWGRINADLYLLDFLCARLDFVATLAFLREIHAKWPHVFAKLVEDKANGPAVISALQREIPGLIAVDPEGGKVVRARAASPIVESGNVWLPNNEHAQRIAREWLAVAEKPGSWLPAKYVRPKLVRNDYLGEMVEWVSEYIDQHAVFPAGVNDDQVDMTSQVIIRLYKKPGTKKSQGQTSRSSAASAIAEMG